MSKVFLIVVFLAECCTNRINHSSALEGTENKYYILEKQKGNSFAITTKCGLYSFLDYNDSLLTISYHLSGAFEYKVSKESLEQETKVITCDAEIVNVGYLDTTVSLKLRFDKITETTTRIIMNKIDNKETSDTIYATKNEFINQYKVLELECDKKAK